jgi:hypothetical protein
MGMSIGSRRTKDAAAAAAADTATSSATTTMTNGDSQGADRDGNGLLGPQSANASGAVPIGGGSGHSPASKRKPLASSFSMLGGLSLAAAAAGGDSGGVTTSRPARTFKGSTSSFIRSWEGLPVSQVMLRTIGEANAGRQTIFGFQILGKVLLWHEIGMGKRVSCDGGLLQFSLPYEVLMPFMIAGLSEPNCLCLLSDMYRRESTYSFRDPDRRADRFCDRRHSLDGRVGLSCPARHTRLLTRVFLPDRPSHCALFPLQQVWLHHLLSRYVDSLAPPFSDRRSVVPFARSLRDFQLHTIPLQSLCHLACGRVRRPLGQGQGRLERFRHPAVSSSRRRAFQSPPHPRHRHLRKRP